MKQKEAPVALPYHVLVGTSRYGVRYPPVTLPTWSSTGWLLAVTLMNSERGGATPVRTQPSRFCRIASKAMLVGKRLRGPSLQLIAGTGIPAAVMSAGRAE